MKNNDSKRAFVNKRSKVTAAEVRRHVVSGLLQSHRTSTHEDDKLFNDTSSKIDVQDPVQPIDVESILAQRKSSVLYSISSPKGPKKIYEFPADDVEVKISKKEEQTSSSHFSLINVENHVRDIYSFYKDDFSVVNRKYHEYSSEENLSRWDIERISALKALRPQVFHCGISISDRVTSTVSLEISDEHSASSHHSLGQGWDTKSHISLLKKASDEKDSQLANLRRKNRLNHVINFLSEKKSAKMEKRAIPPFPEATSKPKLVVKVIKSIIEPFFEPLFVSMTLYDIRKRRKVSETFYFNVSDDDKLDMLGKYRPVVDKKNPQVAFEITSAYADLFLVIKVDKILQQCDVNEASEPYSGSEKNLEKLYSSAEDFCSRLGPYRMPMGIQYIDLQKLFAVNNQLLKPDLMSLSSCTMTSGVTITANGQNNEDQTSITSADRISTATVGSTLRRFGSGTSAAAVLQRVRTPLTKRKFFPKNEENQNDVFKMDTRMSIDNLPLCHMKLSTFFRQETDKQSEDDIFKICQEIRKSNGKCSKKTFNMEMELQISGQNKTNDPQDLASTLTLNAEPVMDVCQEIVTNNFALYNEYSNVLFIYPKMVNLANRQGNARNITIKVELMDAGEKPLNSIYEKGANSEGPFTSSANTTVLYHQRCPFMSDEIKIALPFDLNDGHHLLFTFYHISCKEIDTSHTATPIGYTWLPLYREEKVRNGDFSLPVCAEKLPPSYGYLDASNALPNLKWLEMHKPLFNVTVNVISSIHAQDEHLLKFFTAVSSLNSADTKKAPVGEAQLIHSIENVLKADPGRIVAFLHYILGRIVFLIANPPYSDSVSLKCFECLGQLAKLCTRMLDENVDFYNRSMLLASFFTYRKVALQESRPHSSTRPIERTKVSPTDSCTLINMIETMERSGTVNNSVSNVRIHEHLADVWLLSSGTAKENALTHSWFFLEMLIKTCSEYLSMTGRLYSSRKMRFSEIFLKNVEKIVLMLTQEVIARNINSFDEASTMSNSLAFFIRDTFSIMDRSFSINLLHTYMKIVTKSIKTIGGPDATRLMLIKMDFIKVVCSHEHYLTLNVLFESQEKTSIAAPPPSSLTGSATNEFNWVLNDKTRSTHYLSGIVISDLRDCLASGNMSLCSRAIENIKTLLRTHELDTRVGESQAMPHVASIYKPLVTIVLDYRDRLLSKSVRCSTDGSSRDSFCEQDTRQDVMLAISGRSNTSTSSSKFTLDEPLSKSLICCMIWVLKNVTKDDLKEWISSLGLDRAMELLQIFHYAMNIFEFKEEQIEHETLENVKEEPEEFVAAPIRWRSSTRSSRNCDTNSEISMGSETVSSEVMVSCEVFMCMADVIEAMVALSAQANTYLFSVLPHIFTIIMQGLSCNVSEQILEVLIASQQSFVSRFPALILEQKAELCAEACRQILHHCSSTNLQNIRISAAASVYHLLRESFNLNKNLIRAKMFMSTALSALFSGTCKYGASLNDEYMSRSLEFVNSLAIDDDCFEGVTRQKFIEQVKDVTSNLQTILSSTVRMREHVDDYEMTIDLMQQLVEGYSNNPDLRITWLLNMAERHEKQKNLCEAAHCYLQASALSAEYIDDRQVDFVELPSIGASVFSDISINVLHESNTTNPAKSNDLEGRFQSFHFTQTGFLKLMEKTFTLMEKAQLYELLFPLSMIILSYCHAIKSYSRIASLHKRLSAAAEQINEPVEFHENQSDAWISPLPGCDRRCFGTYFRVAFFGQLFGDLDNSEYVYKEYAFSKLNEISSRLENFYMSKFGDGKVVVLKDSKQVNRTTLDPKKAYLQITFVDIFLADDEKMERSTYFERRNNVKRFFYETPYTLEGGTQGDISKQYKRRTIITVENAFPYIKTRQRVVDKTVLNFTPIEVAIEDIEKKTRELAAAIRLKNPKMLSMLVQGAISTTVNQGPLEIARVFLANAMIDERGKPVDPLQNKLRLAFRHLQHRALEAIQLSSQLISSDQKEYQANVEQNFDLFITQLKPMVTREKNEITFSEFGQPTVV